MPVAAAQVTDHVFAVVRAVVVDEDNLVVDLEFGEGLLQPLVHDRDGLGVFVAGHHRGYAAHRIQTELFRGLKVSLLVFQAAVPVGGSPETLPEVGVRSPL